jgi:hypothetical protein
MHDRDPDGDAAAALMERRWFALMRAVRAKKAECDVLRELIAQAETAWNQERSALLRLELLRDAIAEELLERQEIASLSERASDVPRGRLASVA